MNFDSDELGNGGEQQVCSNRGRRRNTQKQDQDGRHDRPAPNAGHANDQAGKKTRNDGGEFHGNQVTE
ncbi:hypothetical protein D3C83_279890 [compost metagenome]